MRLFGTFFSSKFGKGVLFLVKGNGKGKKQTRFKTYRNASGKAFLALAISGSAVAGTGGVQNADAATINTYYWTKYDTWVETIANKVASNLTESAAKAMAESIGGSYASDSCWCGSYDVYALSFIQRQGAPIGEVSSTSRNAYPDNGGVNEFWYTYARTETTHTNSPPNTPTINVPSVQFEHGDKQLISFSATDPDGDPITYTLQATYDDGKSWSNIYQGPNKVFEYTVPSDKTQVQFRVTASDGKASSPSATSVKKNIREVMYYWSKYNNQATPVNTYGVDWTPFGSYWHDEKIEDSNFWSGSYFTSYYISDGKVYGSGGFSKIPYLPFTGYYISNGEFRRVTFVKTNPGYDENMERGTLKVISSTTVDSKGTLVANNLEGPINKYKEGMKNPDGYWYVRGQRVLEEDTTPPLIELTEQSNYSQTSTVSVQAHDLSGIKTVKYAKGEQTAAYFASNGTVITDGKFTVNANGKYTVYAEDTKGNKAVEVIDVTKVNQKPVVTKPIEEIIIQGKGKEKEIDLSEHFEDPDGHQISYHVVSSSEANVKAVIVGESKLKLTGEGKGKSKLTISAFDGYEATTVQVDVTVSNTKPIMEVDELPNHVVLDDNNSFTIKGKATDKDDDDLSAKVNHLNNEFTAAVSAGEYSVEYPGNKVQKGYYYEALQVKVTDGLEDSETFTATVPIIKVDNATRYTNEMAGHSDAYITWAPDQHEAFYNAYESIFSYESVRTTEELKKAKEAISELKTKTVEESETISSWENRLNLVTATVATEEAEKNLVKDGFEHAKELVEALTSSEAKDKLADRINELQHYHDANDAITKMEEEHGSISWDSIKDAQNKVEAVTNVENKKSLQDRLTQVTKDFMSDLTTITPDDLDKFGVTDVVPEYSEWYDEYKDAFKPLGENNNAQDLVDFVNALRVALNDLTQSAVNTLQSKVPAYSEISLNSMVSTVDELLEKRLDFTNEENRDKTLTSSIQNVKFNLTNDYMVKMASAMKEVIEYNDTHDDKEKSEAHIATEALWQGQLRTDMQEYLDNGIPDIIVTGDSYEYINNGKLNVIASIQDSNDTTHEVEVTFNGETRKLKTTDGKINVTFDLADGVYEDYVTIIAKDKLTKKELIIKNKPVVAVSDVDMYIQFVQALEADKKQSFDAFDLATNTTLKTLYDKTLAIKVNVSSEREIREVENSATKLGGKNGQLETLVKSLVQNYRLAWLINNYKIATDDDFGWAGVSGVTPENIDGLKSIIDDYVASFNGGDVKTPAVADYQNWLNLSNILEEAKKAIEVAEGLHTKDDLADAISQAELVLAKVPDWLSVKHDLQNRLDAVIAYYDVIGSVVAAETTYLQSDKDKAQDLVDKLVDGTPKNNLQKRLDAVQVVIDAFVGVETAETTLEEADHEKAQSLVDKIEASNPKKAELQSRLDALVKLKEAIAAVEQVESTKNQVELDTAKELVNALPDSPKKVELHERLDAAQNAIDNKSREDQAKDAVNNAEDTLQQDDKNKAQGKVEALEEGELKEELQKRLDALQEHIDAYLTAENAVNQAEKSKAQIDVDSAQPLVDVLPASKAKTKLQQRLDAVSKYIQAEKAVSKGESSLIQKHKNEAQLLVDALPNGDDKKELQKRLDALQLAIDSKKEDLLDKIINDLDNVTSQELADYLSEEKDVPVYEELLPEYKDEIGKLGDSVTKEQIIQVIKLVNAIEMAKRTMQKSDINAYEKEYAASTLPTIKSYPQPTVFNSIVDYLHDDNVLGNVIKELAVALKVSEDEIRAEIEKILKDVSEDATTGKYLVQYVNANGEVKSENWVTDVQYGEIEVTGNAPEGYEIVGESKQIFILSDETTNQTITFNIKKIETGDLEESETDVETTTPEKDQQQPNENEDVEKVPGNETHTEEENDSLAETVSHTDIDVKKLSIEEIKSLKPELDTVEDSIFEQYIKHVQDYAAEQEVETFTKDEVNMLLSAIHAAYEQDIEAESQIAKLTEGPVKKVLMDLIKPKTTIGKESALVRSKMQVASLNDNYVRITSTPYTGGIWGTENENHAEYVFKTFYALASVKSYKATPSEKYKEEVKDYIVVNLHDGSYKEMLLGELGYKINEIGTIDDGKPDLTVVKPTPKPVDPPKPPVVKPPVIEPPVVEPPVVDPPTVVDPPVINPNPQPKPEPPVIVPPETGTTAETIEYENGKWTINNPSKDTITVEQDGIKIKIPLEINSKQWSIEWLNKGNNHYKLRIWADGKEINTFKQQIEITKEQKKAYVLRYEDGEYTAVPFKFVKPNQISFKTKRTGEFYFSTKQVKFKDIEGISSKEAIEELANRHIVFGTSTGYYSPNKPLTRAQFCAMLVRSLGLEATGTNTFKDVKAKDWFASDVQALYDAGIIKGVSATKFNPNGTLTRQQAALMLQRTLDYLNVETESYSLNFADADKISNDAKSAVAVMQGLEIFTGKPGNVFDPYSNLTRAQMAKVLLKTLEIADVF